MNWEILVHSNCTQNCRLTFFFGNFYSRRLTCESRTKWISCTDHAFGNRWKWKKMFFIVLRNYVIFESNPTLVSGKRVLYYPHRERRGFVRHNAITVRWKMQKRSSIRGENEKNGRTNDLNRTGTPFGWIVFFLPETILLYIVEFF